MEASRVLGASWRIRISSIMRWRSGETLRGESFMALLRLQNKADCLTSQPTKQSLKPQLSSNPQSELPLPRERFSPGSRSDRRPLDRSRKHQRLDTEGVTGADRPRPPIQSVEMPAGKRPVAAEGSASTAPYPRIR